MAEEIRFKIGIDGARQTEQVLRGLRTQAADTQQAVARGTNQRPGTSPSASPAAKALEQQKRAVEQFERWRRSEESRTARERDAHARAAVQSERQSAQGRLQAIQQFATRAISIYQTVSSRASALSGAFGGRSREAMLSENMNIQLGSARLAADAGLDKRTLRNQLTTAARASGIDPGQLLGALGAHGGGDAATAAMMRSLPTIGRHAQALGTDASNITSVLGQALRMGLREENIGSFLNQYTGIASAQDVSPEALSGKLGQAFATYATATGTSGEEAVLGAMRLQGTIGAAFGGGDRAVAGGYESVMGMLQDEGFQRRLQRAAGTTGTVGGFIGGEVADPMQTLAAIQSSGNIATREQFARLAGSADAGQTLQTLIEAMRSGGSAMQDIMGASGEAGAGYVNDVMGEAQGIAGFGNQAEQMANFMENGQTFARYADTMADGVDTLNSKFPMMVEGLDNATAGISAMTEALGMLSLATGASGAATAVAGGGAAAAGGGGLLAGGSGGALAGGGALMAAGGVATVGLAAALVHEKQQSQARRAAERRANMSVGRGELQDFSEGRLDAGAILERGAERIAGDRAALGAMLSGGTAPAGAVAPLNLDFSGGAPSRQAAAPAAAPASPGRPLVVSFDAASSNSLARDIAAQQAAIIGRGESER